MKSCAYWKNLTAENDQYEDDAYNEKHEKFNYSTFFTWEQQIFLNKMQNCPEKNLVKK